VFLVKAFGFVNLNFKKLMFLLFSSHLRSRRAVPHVRGQASGLQEASLDGADELALPRGPLALERRQRLQHGARPPSKLTTTPTPLLAFTIVDESNTVTIWHISSKFHHIVLLFFVCVHSHGDLIYFSHGLVQQRLYFFVVFPLFFFLVIILFVLPWR
jgi:hypothetical protein